LKQRGNEGSGLVTVLISVAFITTLGALLIYMGFTNMSMKSADSMTHGNFYNVETEVDVLRMTLQNLATDALDLAYQDMYTHYSDYVTDSGRDKFSSTFLENLLKNMSGSGKYALEEIEVIAADGTAKTLKLKLVGYNHNLPGSSVDYVEYSGFAWNDASVTAFLTDIASKDVISLDFKLAEPLSYTDGSYYNEVYTGFQIGVPDVPTQNEPLSEYVLVAENKLALDGENITVSGYLWAGNIVAGATVGTSATLTGEKLFVAGPVSDPGDTMHGSIVVKDSSLTLDYTEGMMVANDLVLDGETSGRSVTLKGAGYNGYGYDGSMSDGSKSSAILVNGTGWALDLSNLAALSLSGRAFIDKGEDGSHAKSYPLTNSISVMSDSFAFLVPAHLLKVNGGAAGEYTNPFVRSPADGPFNPTVDVDSWLWAETEDGSGAPTSDPFDSGILTGLKGNRLSDYGIGSSDIYFDFKQYSGAKNVYCYLDFKNRDGDRTRFFNDYLKGAKAASGYNNGVLFNAYLPGYSLGGTPQTAGTYYTDGSDKGNHVGSASNPAIGFKEKSPFDNIAKRNGILTSSGALGPWLVTATDAGPIDFNGEAINVRQGQIVIKNGDVHLATDTTPGVCLVIATGDIIVDTSRANCMLISAGSIRVGANQSVTAGDANERIREIIAYMYVNDRAAYTELRKYLYLSTFGIDDIDRWNLNEIVSFTNWSKNEDMY
jgi:hypothetical protein